MPDLEWSVRALWLKDLSTDDGAITDKLSLDTITVCVVPDTKRKKAGIHVQIPGGKKNPDKDNSKEDTLRREFTEEVVSDLGDFEFLELPHQQHHDRHTQYWFLITSAEGTLNTQPYINPETREEEVGAPEFWTLRKFFESDEPYWAHQTALVATLEFILMDQARENIDVAFFLQQVVEKKSKKHAA